MFYCFYFIVFNSLCFIMFYSLFNYVLQSILSCFTLYFIKFCILFYHILQFSFYHVLQSLFYRVLQVTQYLLKLCSDDLLFQHDITLAALLSLLGVFDYVNPPYSSAVIIELYRENDTYFVSVYYRNNTFTDAIIKLPLPSKILILCFTSNYCKSVCLLLILHLFLFNMAAEVV